ncbi:MAG: radical SAM/Cys-rich domain protein [bacterium]|nr:radical SAM/Cys-rich domain protein [bacterium]
MHNHHTRNSFDEYVEENLSQPLSALDIDTIQVNIGLLCNMTCAHCHVAAGPRRREQMSWETMEAVIEAARRVNCESIDITGGAPEMNPQFRRFIEALSARGFSVQVRTNLTILLEPGYEDMARFMADHHVKLVASLPCYLGENVDAQRGMGTYDRSIKALQNLNDLGYGCTDALPLDLIYNPLGPVLPPSQEQLEEDYRRELNRRFGIQFTRLHVITNMPIGRFWADLRQKKSDQEYLTLLQQNFNSRTLPGLMCRHQISVDWNGTIHDCDFNLALRMPVNHGTPDNIHDFDPEAVLRRRIATGGHCFGCTAGCGSSCGGALDKQTTTPLVTGESK